MTAIDAQLYFALLMTVLLSINGARELRNGNLGMGTLLIAIPACGWLSVWIKS